MRKQISLLFLSLVFSATTFAQENNSILLVVDGKPVTRSEFEAVYKKNNKKTVISREALEEYLDLYVNFKLKVREAEVMGLDSSVAFRNELAGYRAQLAQPYLTDNEVTEGLIQEAYDRMKTDIHASHILINLAPNALPEDTLKAWNRIMKIRDQIVKEGKSFNEMAMKESDDPSAKDNGGDLGYFTSMMMVYPFENAAYNTSVGEVSMPVRTRFGYHILRINDKRPARGQVLAGHIMVSTQSNKTPEDSVSSRKRIFELYDKLQAGENFEDLARQHSDDRASATKGGQLPWFGTGKMVPEFENQVYALKNEGDYSQPFQSRFGWHIVKKYEQKDIPAFSEVKNEIKSRIARDSRSEKSKDSFISRLKSEYNFTEFEKNRKKATKKIDTTYYSGEWKAGKINSMIKPVFSFGDTILTQADFGKYLEENQVKQPAGDIKTTLDNKYNEWVDKTILTYENNRLEEKYPEFKALMQEYRDGILLFDLTDKKVWSKAVKDTTGLTEFYERNKHKFMWPERVDATIYTASSKKVADQTRNMLTLPAKRKPSSEEILRTINESSELNLKVDSGKYIKSEFPVKELKDWNEGVSKVISSGNQYLIVEIKENLKPEPKTLQEARGVVTAEYQNYLEKKWIDELKGKYKVEVNKDVLNEIK